MPTDLTTLSRKALAARFAGLQREVKALDIKGEDRTLADEDRLEALLDDRDACKAELDARPDTGLARERIDRGEAWLKTPHHVLPHAGETKANDGGERQYATARGGNESECEKFLKRGPFQSLPHFLHATRQAGDRPAGALSGDLKGWHDGIARHDGAIKAMACQGVDVKAGSDAKAAYGLNEFSDSEAAVLIPFQFAEGIWQRAVQSTPLLSLLEMIPVVGNSLRIRAYQDASRLDGSRYGGIQAFWTAEADQYTKTKPSLRTVDLKLSKLTALVFATDELLDDAPAAASEINRIASEEIAFKVSDALYRGTGQDMPLGFLKAPCKVTQAADSGQGANTITAKNVTNMWSRRANPTGQNYVWLANQAIEPQLDQLNFTAGSTAAQWMYLQAGGLTGDAPARLKGRPIQFIEQAEDLGTEGDLLLVDPSQYACIVKSGGLQQAISMHLRFDYGERAFRFSLRMDARPRWEAPLTRFKGTNSLSPIVTLNSSRT